MTNQFDVVVIGAGPCAIAALDALRRDQSIAVVTGESAQSVASKRLHPKINAVSTEARRRAGVAEPMARDGSDARPLFATAIDGGLANY